ncbi:hypothetical protein FA15DRAFT_759474 [Coprinopsis marcescibilis]|uniref:Sodium/calcium exchanger membrane region domain-containing protein n=1 Tax=Coprinopsis marcescibilis TaxID=230819 RepID=A0A5C3KJG2_COPMA|nr:hypothetical protein FA15DRAFT_759474 [Coprinopsis marcescibilis]
MPASVGVDSATFSPRHRYPEPDDLHDSHFVRLPLSDSQGRILSPEIPSSAKASKGGLPFYASESQEKLVGVEALSSRQKWSRHFVGWKIIVFGSWLNILLITIPTAWATKLIFVEAHTLTFSLCILAMIPLVRLHDLSIAEFALRIGGSKTGLLNASMSNFVEIVVAISALRKCELRVVQSSLVGSILSKLLLVLGLCFFAGGMRFSEQGFDPTATQIHSSLLIISVGVLLLPAAYHFTLSLDGEAADLQRRDILNMSHGVSVVLMFIYGSYLAFQFWSHSHLYNDNHNKKSERLPATQNISAEKAAAYLSAKSRSTFRKHGHPKVRSASSSSISPSVASLPPLRPRAPGSLRAPSPLVPHRSFSTSSLVDTVLYAHPQGQSTVRLVENDYPFNGMARQTTTDSTITAVSTPSIDTVDNSRVDSYFLSLPEEGKQVPMERTVTIKEPQLSWFMTSTLLLIVTVAVAVMADWLVEAMDGISSRVSKDWIALILLPVISSTAELITAMRVSVRDELSLSVSVAVGSTIQTALFVIPFMVILAWIVNKPLTLLMDPFQSLVLYLSVQTTSYVIADGKSNWLEGVILVSLYIIIAVSFWFYPGSVPLDFLVACPPAP